LKRQSDTRRKRLRCTSETTNLSASGGSIFNSCCAVGSKSRRPSFQLWSEKVLNIIISPVGGLGKFKEIKGFPEIVLFYQMTGIYHYFTLKDCLLKN